VTKQAPYTTAVPDGVLDLELAWSLLLTLAQQAREGRPLLREAGFAPVRGSFRMVPIEEALCIIDPRARPGRQVEVRRRLSVHPDVRGLFELYLPLVIGERAGELTVGHFGPESDDSRSHVGDAGQLVRTREEQVHTHRMRALFDAVILGVRTVLWDDPQMTTRLVPGPHPTRVILDPHGRLENARQVLTDTKAPTIICVDPALLPQRTNYGHLDYLGVPTGPDGFDGRALLQALRATFGLHRVFVEGGSTTVSRLLTAGLLDRVQVSVAPVVLGSGPVLRLSPLSALQETLSPSCRHFRLGSEAFFDFDLSKPGAVQQA
jgi:diaminohydroxyphosphoribosylaminopyrimidine deaminase/5-amino-6-(5-phosphoribosylamino)uracil reductase